MSVHGIIYCIKNLVNEKMYVGQTIKSKRTTTFGGYLWRYDGDIVNDDEIFRASISTRIGGLFGKHIMLVSTEGQELRRFISCAQAARELGLKQHQVARCVSGRLKNVSGFIFRVADEV